MTRNLEFEYATRTAQDVENGVAPVAFFGLFYKTRLHYIGIQYKTPDDKTAGILLQGDKDNYRAILVAVQGVTGVPVSVGERNVVSFQWESKRM
jgi:hypothetical protein